MFGSQVFFTENMFVIILYLFLLFQFVYFRALNNRVFSTLNIYLQRERLILETIEAYTDSRVEATRGFRFQHKSGTFAQNCH